MSDLIERLRDKARLRAAHGLTGWVLAEEALLAQAADEIERLTAERDETMSKLANLFVAFNDWKVFHSTTRLEVELQLKAAENDELRRKLAEADKLIAHLQDALSVAVNATMEGRK